MLDFLRKHNQALFILFFGYLFFQLSQLIPQFADDYCRFSEHYQFVNILNEVKNDYLNWTGRFLVMFINRSIFSLNDIGLQLINVTNTLLFMLTIRIAMKYAEIETKRIAATPISMFCFFGFFIFLFWFTPTVFAEAVLWKTGSIQYFWGSVITLVVLHPLIKSIFDKDLFYSNWQSILYIMLCFAGGTWLENLSVAVVPVWIFIFWQIKFKQNRTLNKTHIIGLVAWITGAILLVIAPGNYVRAETINDSTTILNNFLPTLNHIFQYLDKSLLLIYLLFSIVLLLTNPDDARRKFCQSGIFMSIGILSILSMMAAPASSFLNRVAFPFEFFMIFATICLFPNKLLLEIENYTFPSRLFTMLATLLLFTVAFSYQEVHKAYAAINQQEKIRKEITELARNAGAKNAIELPALFLTDKHNTTNGRLNKGHFFASDITQDSSHWRNVCYANAHQIPLVRLIDYANSSNTTLSNTALSK